MDNYLISVLVAFGVVILITLISFICFYINNKINKSSEQAVYDLKPLLTKNEKDCFNHIKSLFYDYHVCPQVSMGALLNPKNNGGDSQEDRTNMMVLRNKISSKIVDFVMLDKNLNPAFIIELDDSSHDNKVEQDKQRDHHFLLAGLPTVRFRRIKGQFPNRKEIELLLKEQNSK